MISLFFSAQVESLKRKMDNLNSSNMYVQNIICDYWGGEHAYSECQVDNYFYLSFEQTNFVDNIYRPPNNPTSTLNIMNRVINLTFQCSSLKKIKLI